MIVGNTATINDEAINIDERNVSNAAKTNEDLNSSSSSYFSDVLNKETSTIKVDLDLHFKNTKMRTLQNHKDLELFAL